MKRVAIIGGGPAGLRAAEVLAESGVCVVTLCDAMPSVGRKFLVAGRGGLNLTHSEPLPAFVKRYHGGPWARLLAAFEPEEVRAWSAALGSATFVGSSGRVFPVEKQSARLLRAWVRKLRALGVEFRVRHRLMGLQPGPVLDFGKGGEPFDAVVLALGGASWPQTGSVGNWPTLLEAHGVRVMPWQAANCGWEVDWPEGFLREFEGTPLKNLAVTVGGETFRGELLITRYGLEGGALYLAGHALQAMERPLLLINFKPDTTKPLQAEKLTPVLRALLEWKAAPLGMLQAFPLELRQPRPVTEAISSAGGVAWEELDETLQLRKLPGVWVCGEMIDWEAPTGGYLLQGCLATGTVAAHGVLLEGNCP